MTVQSKTHLDAVDPIPTELAELSLLVSHVPAEHRPALQAALDKVADGARRRRQILCLVQEALSQLRMDMKYLVFDLEATRRERDEYKRRLEQNQGPA